MLSLENNTKACADNDNVNVRYDKGGLIRKGLIAESWIRNFRQIVNFTIHKIVM